MMGGAPAGTLAWTAGMRPGSAGRLKQRPKTMGFIWVAPPQATSLLSDHGFESDRSTVSTSSLVSSMSEKSGGSRHPHCGRCPHREPGGHLKINLPVIKDEDTKDAVTYQSWHWDLTVYHHAGC